MNTQPNIYDRMKDGRYVKAMVQDSPVPMLVTDQTGAFLDANKAACKFFGCSVEEICSMRFQEVTHREDLILSMEMVNVLNQGKEDHFEMVKRYVTKKGVAWAAVRVNAIRGEEGKVESHVIHIIPLLGCTDDVMRDILGNMTGRGCKSRAFFWGATAVLLVEVVLHCVRIF